MFGRLRELLPFARYRIEGESMAPALSRGERVLVNRAAYWFAKPKAGHIVVVRDPREPDRILIKRIEREENGAWHVLGDNPDASTDSRTFGSVSREQIIGKVLFRY